MILEAFNADLVVEFKVFENISQDRYQIDIKINWRKLKTELYVFDTKENKYFPIKEFLKNPEYILVNNKIALRGFEIYITYANNEKRVFTCKTKEILTSALDKLIGPSRKLVDLCCSGHPVFILSKKEKSDESHMPSTK